MSLLTWRRVFFSNKQQRVELEKWLLGIWLRDDSQPVALGINHNLTVVQNLVILIRGLFCLQKQGLILFHS